MQCALRYNLLGGKTKDRVPCYATTSRPDIAKDMGFHGAKVRCPLERSARARAHVCAEEPEWWRWWSCGGEGGGGRGIRTGDG